MEFIEIDIDDKKDFFEKYNNNVVSNQLLNYIIEKALIKKTSKQKIIIKSKLDLDFKTLIIEGLKKELEKSNESKKKFNIMQIKLILLGIFFIFLSALINNYIVWNEVVLIIGWVSIWEAIDIELIRDSKERKRRYIIKKLLNSDFDIVNK